MEHQWKQFLPAYQILTPTSSFTDTPSCQNCTTLTRAFQYDGIPNRQIYEAYRALIDYAQSLGLTHTEVDDNVDAKYNGYYWPAKRLIYVKPGEQARMTKTMIHELAHHFEHQHHNLGKPEKEIFVEAVAFIVCDAIGIDAGSYSFPYIAEWAGCEDGAKLILQMMQPIQQTAALLIDAVTQRIGAPADPNSDSATSLSTNATLTH